MQNPISFRNIAIVGIASVTIWLIFSEGTLSAVLFAGLFFFVGSLFEVFQRREILEPRRLILFTMLYTVSILAILMFFIWRYRIMFL